MEQKTVLKSCFEIRVDLQLVQFAFPTRTERQLGQFVVNLLKPFLFLRDFTNVFAEEVMWHCDTASEDLFND
jgi:hypothetical protein